MLPEKTIEEVRGELQKFFDNYKQNPDMEVDDNEVARLKTLYDEFISLGGDKNEFIIPRTWGETFGELFSTTVALIASPFVLTYWGYLKLTGQKIKKSE